jgi:hypothetical protein
MSELVKDFFGVLMAIVGVAILTTLVLPGRQTPAVINATFGGFASAISAAMGGSVTSSVGSGVY